MRQALPLFLISTLLLSAAPGGNGSLRGATALQETTNWYNKAWRYRRTITVNNSSNTNSLSAFQIKITLNSANFAFAKSLQDGSDLRVTDSDGKTLIPYYIQSYNRSARTGTIWVRVPFIPGSTTKTIYLYYGNSSPTSFALPPTGLFTRPTSAVMNGLAENMVFDSNTNKYYVVYSASTTGPIKLAQANSPSGPWTDVKTTACLNQVGTILCNGTSGQWDDANLYAPHLLQSGGTWYLFYSGGRLQQRVSNDEGVGVATASSITGPYARPNPNIPIISNTNINGSWEQYRACEPYVYHSDILKKWVLLYMGDAGDGDAHNTEKVGFATADSPAGPWTKYASNPVIDFSPAPAWDAGTVADPFAIEIDGVAYIFYTGSPTSVEPWTIGFATTRDYVTFTKGYHVYGRGAAGEWDASDAFRGAVTKFNNTWYMPYGTLGICCDGKWGIATMSALSTTKGFDPFQVFDYYDDFSGTALSNDKWGHPSQPLESGRQSVSNGILTIDTGPETGKYRTLVGRREFGAGYMIEFLSRHNNADGRGNHAAEAGFGTEDRNNLIRIYDYNTTCWLKDSTKEDKRFTDNMPQAIDTGWHTHRIAFVSPSPSRYQNDNNSWEPLDSLNIPTISLKPWLFTYSTAGNTTTMDIDYVFVKKYSDPEPTVSVSPCETMAVLVQDGGP